MVEEFTPEESEDRLYDLVSEYLRRDNLQALPASQRSLMTLVLRKLLASSTFAIAGALDVDLESAQGQARNAGAGGVARRGTGSGLRSARRDRRGMDARTSRSSRSPRPTAPPSKQEIADLDEFAALATSIEHNAKGKALAQGAGHRLRQGRGAWRRAKGDHLHRIAPHAELSAARAGRQPVRGGHRPVQRLQHRRPLQADLRRLAAAPSGHRSRHRLTTADMRSALVDYFREEGRIMIATEAGAEGINLQFCSLVVNYDLPWNPQRIEQRIGRCHRYGQKHDVVVVNFLNRKNAADQRVFELLSEKFKLFEGVFGASDEVLGAIESGVDFEKRIADIYQRCRKPEEIQAAFDQLQLELSLEINEAMTRTRQQAAGELRRRGAREAQGPRRGLQGVPQPLRAPADAAHAARTGRPRRVR